MCWSWDTKSQNMPHMYSSSSSSSSGLTTSESPAASSESSSSELPSLLSRLRAPLPSNLARKRTLKTNPPVGAKCSKAIAKATPKNVSPSDRVRAFPGECLVVSNKQLFCSACREKISGITELHIKSQKHTRGKRQLQYYEKRDMDIAQALQVYNSEVHPSGERMPESTRIYRVKVVTALLKAGTPLSKIDNF